MGWEEGVALRANPVPQEPAWGGESFAALVNAKARAESVWATDSFAPSGLLVWGGDPPGTYVPGYFLSPLRG